MLQVGINFDNFLPEDIDDIIEGTEIHNHHYYLTILHHTQTLVKDSDYQQEEQIQCSSPILAKIREVFCEANVRNADFMTKKVRQREKSEDY